MRFRGSLLLFSFVLVACSGGNDLSNSGEDQEVQDNAPAVVAGDTEEVIVSDLPEVAVVEQSSVELPPIPAVEFETRDAWFTPTPVDEIVLASGGVQLIDFSAIWCSYCRQMAPVLEGLEILYGEEANFIMIDLDLDGNDQYGPFIDELAYDPRFRPGIYILSPDGEVLNTWLGPVDGHIIQEALVAAISQYQ